MVATPRLAVQQDALAVKYELEIELARTKHDILKWTVTGMITQTAPLVGIIAFLS